MTLNICNLIFDCVKLLKLIKYDLLLLLFKTISIQAINIHVVKYSFIFIIDYEI